VVRGGKGYGAPFVHGDWSHRIARILVSMELQRHQIRITIASVTRSILFRFDECSHSFGGAELFDEREKRGIKHVALFAFGKMLGAALHRSN
jgi:hypothetical protein